VRTRIRALIAVGVVVAATLFVAAPAFAAGRPAKPADEAAEQCIAKLEAGGAIDDCQKAPSPLKPENNEIIWGSLAFLVLLGFFFWKGIPAVKNMEKAREDRIRNDLESAERAKNEAENERAQYEGLIAQARTEAGTIIDEARQAAEAVKRDITAKAEEEANEIRARAQADIANQTQQAMAQLHDDVAQLSIELAGRIVERNLDTDTNRQLVNNFIDELARSN
jgi:F-type H+-transporting ATPase subunit b